MNPRKSRSWSGRGTVDVALPLEVVVRSVGYYSPGDRETPPEHVDEREIIEARIDGEVVDDELLELLKPYIQGDVDNGKLFSEDD